MHLDEALKNTAVIGAAGKMGKGIALLLLQQIAMLGVQDRDGDYRLHCIDANDRALGDLHHYLQAELRRYAEKSINALRRYYADEPKLVSNAEIINAFVDRGLELVRLGTELKEAQESNLIFEAIIEDIDAKVALLSALPKEAFYFSNTSSIPIHVLDEKSGLNGKIIGFHFYNPPAVQKLLEIISPKDVNPELQKLALELAKRLGKTVVKSSDVAGFIGNGHFIREILFACAVVNELTETESKREAIAFVDYVTRDLLLRPMGIFELVDYVGPVVCQRIIEIMSIYLDTPIVDITAYPTIPPKQQSPWKALLKDPNRQQKIEEHFQELFQEETNEARLAKRFLEHSEEIARNLVRNGVAKSLDDVTTVLQEGFYHLYGVVHETV